MHDKTLKRVSKSKKGKECPLREKVAKLNWQDISNNCLLENDKEIPRFIDIVNYLKTTDQRPILFIEFKSAQSETFIDEFLELLSFYPIEKLRYISFGPEHLLAVREVLGEELTPKMFWLKRIFTSDFDERFSGVDFFMFPLFYSTSKKKREIRKLKERGLESAVYTKNKVSTIVKFANLGVDFITTDRPSVCAKALNSRI